ncbi:hypothetical protein F157LOC_03323 [Pectobacterium brasiliense]|uniref:AAA family ATPase n=1 Tax=Pectobacterium brasiliense TaxID=180957 RepID=UPI000CE69383|nr:AAA family ATPase [Pectobacterium brasiliense]PPE57777.1 hypothetical protein F157LOC_03323 [Pectobacterium brasiliense]
MISEIITGEASIKLTNKPPENISIYSIDSLSLLIGINGSGKTKSLCSIVNYFFPKNNMHMMNECNIFNQSGEKIDFTMIKNWGLVYFTPLPFRPKLDIRNDRFINASPSLNGKNIVFDLIENNNFLSDFGITPRIVATSETNIKKTSRLILNTILGNKDLYIDNLLLSNNLSEIISLQKKINNNKSENEYEEEMVSYDNKKIQAEIEDIMKHCSNILIDDIFLSMSEKQIFIISCIIDWASKKRQFNTGLVSSLLSEYFPAGMFSVKDRKENKLYFECLEKISNLETLLLNEALNHKISATHNSLNNNMFLNLEFEINQFNGKDTLKKYKLDSIFDIGFSEMSSGQVAILAQIGAISNSIIELSKKGIKSILLLIDEGDAFLHLDWQRKYISSLDNMLGNLKKSLNIEHLQLIIATHSPLLATDVPKEFITKLPSDNNKISGFASPLYVLLNESFSTKTIGEFAAKKIEDIINRIPNKSLKEEDFHLIKSIDNPLIKKEIERLLNNYDILVN